MSVLAPSGSALLQQYCKTPPPLFCALSPPLYMILHRIIPRRVRGKARTRLRYNQWVNSMDNWLSDEVPKLADYDRRQFPVQNMRYER